jgi:hypothetical protein
MRGASTTGSRVRSVALLALGALAVHQGRYLLAPADGAHGHTYLELLGPAVGLLTVAAVAVSFAATLARRCLPTVPAPEAVTDRAAAFAVGLVAVYMLQETAEGIVAGDHQPFAHLGYGGWLVLPLAMAVGGLAALAGRWLDRTELRAAIALLGSALPRPPRAVARPRARRGWVPGPLLARSGLAPRAPPGAVAG